MNFLRIILLAFVTLIFSFISVLNADVDEDCLCNLKDNGHHVSGDIYVDSCGIDKECDGYNYPYYFTEFNLITKNNYKFTELDTGLLDFKNLPDSMSIIRNKLNELDSKYILNEVRVSIIGKDVGMDFSISTFQTREELEPNVLELFQPKNLFFPQIIVTTEINNNPKDFSYEFDIESGFVKINSKKNLKFAKIIDINGKIKLFKNIDNKNNVTLDIQSFPKGIYFLIIDNENAISLIK